MSDIYRRFDTDSGAASSSQSQMNRPNTPNPAGINQPNLQMRPQRPTPAQNPRQGHSSQQRNTPRQGHEPRQHNTIQDQPTPNIQDQQHLQHNQGHNHPASGPFPQQEKRVNPNRNKKKVKGFSGILQNILPPTVYNPDTKKILGFLSAEDLLLVALIFLFLDNDEEDNTIMVLALIFVLISDYIDLSDFSF